MSDYRNLDETQEIEADGRMEFSVSPEGVVLGLPSLGVLITLEPDEAREFAETILEMLRHYEESHE